MSGAIAAAAIGAAVAIGTAAASGAAASKSKKAAREAEQVAKKKLEEARKEIERMPLQELSLDLQGFKAEQEASQVAAAQSMQAAKEGGTRGLAAAAGRTQMADIAQQRAARLDKASELQALEMTKAKERQEASDKLAGLSLAEAEGAQQAAADSEAMAAQYESQAIQSGMQAVQGVANVAGAALTPSMEMGAAYDKNLSSVPEQDLKSFLMSNKKYSDVLGGSDIIKGMDANQLRKSFVNKNLFNIDELSNPDFLGEFYTPQSGN
jgi:hypothetical protein